MHNAEIVSTTDSCFIPEIVERILIKSDVWDGSIEANI